MNIQLFLKNELERRKKFNQSYSLRALARDMNVDSSLLVKIVNGKRKAGPKMCRHIEERLNLKSGTFSSDVPSRFIKEGRTLPLGDEHYFNVISQWEHFTVLNLLYCPGFQHSLENVAKLLDIGPERASQVISELKNVGLLVEETLHDGIHWSRGTTHIKTTDGVRSLALRLSHLESLDLAKTKLEAIPLEERDFSAVIFPVDLKVLPFVKEMIARFRDDLEVMVNRIPQNKESVYQLSLQLFPLSQSTQKIISQHKEGHHENNVH
jgi:transcriptional regulator with XRE-family HTH domain